MTKSFWTLFILFILLNFGALALGSFFMGEGPISEWYQQLNKAPWTPPGWVFGVSWFTIMVCLSIALACHFSHKSDKSLIIIYGIHLALNIAWNYLFFNQRWLLFGFMEIILLTGIVFYMLVHIGRSNKLNAILLSPYVVWLCIASSLNWYALMYN
ncbi:MAG: tryptophan-rich sensory protein [Crocinitomicaceae bacterium]|nr:tryptophan-rich sensory protein [Crocinitomicaceae bacterium]